jgi:uncharacterized protein involved in exopolysaccharide biosynthesis
MQDDNAFDQSNYELTAPTLRDLLAALFRHRQLMALSFLGILLGAVLAGLLLPKQYEARMEILVKRERADPVVTSESSPQLQVATNVTEEELNSEVELLKSRDLLEKVVLACGLYAPKTHSLWASLSPAAEAQDAAGSARNDEGIPQAVRKLERKLGVERVNKTNLIAVTYSSSDPQLAAQVLTKLAELYLEKHIAVHRPPGAFDFFKQETQQYRAELASREARLAAFGRESGVISADLEKEVTLRKLHDFESDLQVTQASIRETEQRIRALEKQAASMAPRVTTQVRTSDNPQLMEQLKSTLLNLELKRTELLTKFDPSYRLVQEVETEIAQTRAAIAEAEKAPLRDEVTDRDPTYEWIRSELAKSRANLASLQARAAATAHIVKNYQVAADHLDQQGMVQQDLTRAVKATEANYLLYLHKQEEARISNALDSQRIVNVAVAEAATVPALPVRSPSSFILLGGLLAALVSVGSAFGADYFDPHLRTSGEVETVLNMPVLAAIPKNGK